MSVDAQAGEGPEPSLSAYEKHIYFSTMVTNDCSRQRMGVMHACTAMALLSLHIRIVYTQL